MKNKFTKILNWTLWALWMSALVFWIFSVEQARELRDGSLPRRQAGHQLGVQAQ